MQTKKLIILILVIAFAGAGAFGTGAILAEYQKRKAKSIASFSQTAESVVEGEDNAVGETSKEEENQNEGDNEIQAEIKEYSFAVIGDTQGYFQKNPSNTFPLSVSNIRKKNVSLIISTGDLVNSCDATKECEEKFNTWKGVLGNFMPKTYPVQGNHDRTGKDKSDMAWQSSFALPTNGPPGFSELVYSFDFENSHFVFLDSDKPRENNITADQRTWLDQDLAKNSKENTFVIIHEPAYPVSSKIGEALDVNASERNDFWNIITKRKVTAVFSGHEHIFSRKNISGIYQFVVGNTETFNHEFPKPGMAEYAYSNPHFLMVKVKGKEVGTTLYTPDGKELNTFNLPIKK
jgi:hypothetical protein